MLKFRRLDSRIRLDIKQFAPIERMPDDDGPLLSEPDECDHSVDDVFQRVQSHFRSILPSIRRFKKV